MSSDQKAIEQYAADVVAFARDYHMDDRGYLPLAVAAKEYANTRTGPAAQKLIEDFKTLPDTDDCLRELNLAIKIAEARYKADLAENVVTDALDNQFNIASNPDLVEALHDYVIETTKDEVLEIKRSSEDRSPLISVNSSSQDLAIVKTNQVNSALTQDWVKAGVDYYKAAGNKNEKLAAKALKAQVQLHNTTPQDSNSNPMAGGAGMGGMG